MSSTATDSTDLVTGSWEIDPAHSEIAFTARHLMSKVRGTFSRFNGTITTVGEDAAGAGVEVSIDASSISTNNEQRDAHLRSADFFATETAPAITFTSTSISGDADAFVITGDLTIRGVTKSVDLQAEILGVAVDAYGSTRLGAEATTSIVRKDFGVDFNIPLDGGRFLIGDKVDIFITIQAVKVDA